MSHDSVAIPEEPAAGGSSAPLPASVDIVIVGAGFGGLGAAIELKQRGHSFVLVEKSNGVGGTWQANTYPGAACDIPSHLYSFSFHPGRWSRRYPPQREILAYLESLVDHYGLAPHLRCGVEVTEVAFEDGTGRWTVRLADGSEVDARAVISAVGQLNRPALAPIPGADTFTGPVFHSARWRHDVDLSGKRVAVVGTGASAIQFVPEIAKVAAHVDVFQRSAPYVIPKPDRPYHPGEKLLFDRVPGARLAERLRLFLMGELGGQGILGNPKIRALLEKRWRDHMESQIDDPGLRAACTPDYVVGCKRVLFSNDWYPTLALDHVDLVTDRITEITPAGVHTSAGERPADVLIWGTGFAATHFLHPMRITGAGRRELHDAWAGGAHANLGIMVSGFPNLFLLYGPNTNLGSNSIVFMLETQIGWVMQALDALREHGGAWLDVRPDVQADFVRWVDEKSSDSAWVTGCESWYTTDGRNTNNWPAATYAYRHRLRHFRLLDHQLQPAPEAAAV